MVDLRNSNYIKLEILPNHIEKTERFQRRIFTSIISKAIYG